MKKTTFEEMGGTYIRHGDYLIPCLTLPEEEEQRFIGVWGQRHKYYLKERIEGIAETNEAGCLAASVYIEYTCVTTYKFLFERNGRLSLTMQQF